MIAVSVEIQNLEQLRANFQKAPSLTLKYLAQATVAALAEVDKEAVDRNFQFKTPRPLRTGFLQQSFAQGRRIENGGLRGSIGPTVKYAPYVYFGTSKGAKPNPFMDRIAKAAEPEINRHFEKATELIVSKLAAT